MLVMSGGGEVLSLPRTPSGAVHDYPFGASHLYPVVALPSLLIKKDYSVLVPLWCRLRVIAPPIIPSGAS